ncbi:MAG TPA: hypothetical protein PKA13_00420 [Geminicoccaceae bacterium]|nr:hypothetical protein [Geminicoccus sp.]HMU48202.1 hypothetical protein [Geminicoccaceae bacterium]
MSGARRIDRRGLSRAWATLPLVTALVGVLVLGTKVVGMVGPGLDDVVAAVTDASHGDDLTALLEEASALALEPAAGPEAEPAHDDAPPPHHDEAAATDATAPAPAPGDPASCPVTVAGLEDVAADLVQRRQQMGARETRLALREAALAEAEAQLARRADELDGMRRTLEEQMGKLAQGDDARIAQLVKVYETMKPKQAAEVFDRLDLELLTHVASRMREVKMAAVLAAMDPEKARRVTVELARRRAPAASGG